MRILARWLEGGTIRSRLMGALGLLALLPILVLGVSLYLAGRMSGDARRVELAGSLRMRGFVVAAHLNSHIIEPSQGKRAIVEEELSAMDAALGALESGSQALRVRAVRGAPLRAQVTSARQALQVYVQVTQRVFMRVEQGFASSAQRAQTSREVLDSASGVLGPMQRLVHGIEEQSSAALRRLWMLQAIAVAVALVVALITVWAVDRFVLRPIPALLAAFSDVQSGRYGSHVDVRGGNEFSGLAQGFNRMSSTLEHVHHDLVLKQGEILEKNTALERASKLKSQFVANMSHELRTPLNAIIGYTKLLRSGVYGPLPQNVHEPLQGIDETSMTLLGLINDILDVAKIEAGRLDVQLEAVSIGDVVRQAGDLLRPLAVGKGLELALLAEDAAMPHVTTDRDMVRRVLLNLGGNAIKFTRRGRVEIEIVSPARLANIDSPLPEAAPPSASGRDPREAPRHLETTGDLATSTSQRGVFFEIRVRDTGMGVAPQDLDAIFEDFRQLDGSAAREQGGTGLGLGISRRLARHLGGDILVRSRLGMGSTFILRLPVFAHLEGDRRESGRAASPIDASGAIPRDPPRAVPHDSGP